MLVAGDTNMNGDDEDELETLLSAAGLGDACRSLGCDEPGRIDGVMFHSSDALELDATRWGIDERFVDAGGEPLSDHEALAVSFEWSAR